MKRKVFAEMSMADLNQIEKFADSELSPEDIEFTRHFFERLADPRNQIEITQEELLGFFKRLAKNKDNFQKFIKRYEQFVVSDRKTKLNIPFAKTVDKLIAKTVMRKSDFLSSNPKFQFESELRNFIRDTVRKELREHIYSK